MPRTFHRVPVLGWLLVAGFASMSLLSASRGNEPIMAELLVVGGTESGCAAAVQAARMGIQRIVLVNDTAWLGGQFSSEALGAIDENRGPEGYGHGVPFPRAGLFREVIDAIEQLNQKRYGHPRPGNTRVITTCRPHDAAQVFSDLVQPYIDSGQLQVLTPYYPTRVQLDSRHPQVKTVTFRKLHGDESQTIAVTAKLTIDASDWGDVIKLAGAEYDCGPDLRSKYGEPLAPESHREYPHTDMNPITYCLVLEQTPRATPIAKPATYDRACYEDHPYPKSLEFLYTSRRLIDGRSAATRVNRDVVLICFPLIDYPLDVLPGRVVRALEADESGASKKNIVEMTRRQRQIIFDDAKQHSLGFLYYLQAVASPASSDPRYDFRHMRLSREFATVDFLPPKPYIRESLRLRAMYMMKQQDTTGAGGDSHNYGSAMYEDGIACWQFEYDFHPTGRRFVDPHNPDGAWRGYLKPLRKWGPPYSGRCLFPARSLVPIRVDGLLGAQKNLGYSAVVSSAVRLHDQSMAIGQAAGAVAAVSLTEHVQPRTVVTRRERLAQVWKALCNDELHLAPAMLWPFEDIEPDHPAFVAVNQLAIRRALPLQAHEVAFEPEQIADAKWMAAVERQSRRVIQIPPDVKAPRGRRTRGEFARQWWNQIRGYPDFPFPTPGDTDDFDNDAVENRSDPLPWTTGTSSWPDYRVPPHRDGVPPVTQTKSSVTRFDFGGPRSKPAVGFRRDHGAPYDGNRGYGWRRDLRRSFRERGRVAGPQDSFVFTRSHDVWELRLPNGRYQVTVCVGDSAHDQVGQHVQIEGIEVIEDVSTPAGQFREATVGMQVEDGRLTVHIGKPGSNTNTCLNWIVIAPQRVP